MITFKEKEIITSWRVWLLDSIGSTIMTLENIDDNDDVDRIINYICESIEMDCGKFKRGIKREIRRIEK